MSTTESKKGWLKSSIKSFVITFIVSFAATMCLLAYNTVQKTKDDIWNELGCPYDIREEYLDNNLYTTIREKLIEYGFSDDNFISNLIKGRQLALIQAMEKKIPADDSIIDGEKFFYHYHARIYEKDRKLNLTELLELKSIAENLIYKKSRIKKFQKRDRYILLSNIPIYISESSNLKDFSKENQNDFLSTLNLGCTPMLNTNKEDFSQAEKISYFYKSNACLTAIKGIYDAAEYVACDSDIVMNTSSYFSRIYDYMSPEDLLIIKKLEPEFLFSLQVMFNNYNLWLSKNCPQNKVIP